MTVVLTRLLSRMVRALLRRVPATGPRRRALRRRLRQADQRLAGHGAWRRADAVRLSGRMGRIVGSPDDALRAWTERKPLAATYLHPVDPDPGDAMRATAAALLEGRFTPHASVPERHEPLPPGWERRAGSRRTEEMYRHALRWLEPLVCVAVADEDARAWRATTTTVVSWISANGVPSGRSPGAWHDHAVSIRARVLCWFFELYRRRPDADPAVLRLLVASIHQHGLYLADPSTYTPRSNHALETNGSLLAVCATVPELTTAPQWERLARRRLERYVAEAFTDDGFSREQSPRYHFFILRRLAAVASWCDAVGVALPPAVTERLHQATVVWPWLVRSDGSLPRIGDTNDHALPQWRSSLIDATGTEPSPPRPSTTPNPRDDGAAMLLSFDAGYAVLRGDDPAGWGVGDDTHVVFKCNYFRYPHFHQDGLSFVLHALGRDWLIDPGLHSYEYDRWERRYVVSSSAHNTVEVGARFDAHPVELVDAARTARGDRVTVRHLLGHATHVRTVEHRPPRVVHVCDDVEVTDGTTRDVRQLFHAAPDCEVQVDGRRLVLRAPDGARCVLTQEGDGDGEWRVVRGQRHPEPLGWWSPGQMRLEPTATCSWATRTGATVRFATHIEVRPAASDVA